ERSARSPIFAEACDFACCICDRDGRLVSQLSGIPILATAGSFSVKAVLARYGDDIREGDGFIINDPYNGGNHLPDIGIITPVFDRGKLLFFCVSRAHHGDIGGSTAGSYNPKATEIFQEGIVIPPTRVMAKDEILTDVFELIAANTRNPQMLKSDLLAQIGANRLAIRRLREMLDSYGGDAVDKAVKETLAQTTVLTRKSIAEIPDGDYEAIEYIDDDGWQEEPVKIQVTVKVRGDELLVDFDGTDPAVKGFINTSVVTATAAAGIGVLWFLGSHIPRNGGAFDCVDVNLPPGSLVNPPAGSPVTLCTLTPASEIVGTVFQALDKAVPGRVSAGTGRYAGPSFYGTDPRNGRYYVGFSFCSTGSAGALKGWDGKAYISAMSNFGGVKNPNIESNEVQYPHITLYHEMMTDTAGAGEYRGGCGMRFAFEIYDDDSDIVMFGDGMKFAPYGLNGGGKGSLNKGIFLHNGEKIKLASKEYPRKAAKGDRVYLESSGGGGWGDPLNRDPYRVLDDVLDEIVSSEMARELYGVVIEAGEVDMTATEKLRREKRKK
ncbi:MAG: hydantoinase B/oxoprolinase family protein, partial [Bacillota bacterium]|nr:hydantoinase B/oxoprolinase family protein [Bacillota bacterium]